MELIQKRLLALGDAGYRDFHSKLIPNIPREKIIGVRTPAIKALAKELQGSPEAECFLRELPHLYYDENQLHAHLLNGKRADLPELLVYVEEFLPHIDNWATCDSLSIKRFAAYPQSVYAKCLEWLASPHCYTVRFAIDVLLQHYLDANFQPETLKILAKLNREEYYINMALAWYLSFALIKQYEATVPLFQKRRLDPWLHKKSIQKAIESRRISPERKAYLRSLR